MSIWFWDHLMHNDSNKCSLDIDNEIGISEEFKRNGLTCEIDEMDIFQLKCRKNASLKLSDNAYISNNNDTTFDQRLETTRNELSKLRPLQGKKICVFCKNNRERESVYTTHVVKDEFGRVSCPILFQYTCPMCMATGLKAHTIKYCPYNDGSGTVDALFHTPRNCAGKQRHRNLPH